MSSQIIITRTSQDDLHLIVDALAAYQHYAHYRGVYARLIKQFPELGPHQIIPSSER